VPPALPRPKPKPKTKELTNNAPKEDPIYTASYNYHSGTSESESAEDTNTCDSGDQTNPDRSRSNQDAFLNDVDPLLSTITSIFSCGVLGPLEPPSSRKGKPDHQLDSRDESDEQGSESEADEEYKSPTNRRQAPGIKVYESKSSADSSQLVKELNGSTDDEGAKRPASRIPRVTSREKMEQSVLRALSLHTEDQMGQKPTTEYRDRITVTTQDGVRDGLSTTSSLTASHKSRLAALSQRVKFRRWMRRRRGNQLYEDETEDNE
jgi:hypothetical protein